MAKAEEFQWAAGEVKAEADGVENIAQRITAEGDEVSIQGGAVAQIVDEMFAMLAAEVESVSNQCDQVADQMLDRAKQCQLYTEEVRKAMAAQESYDDLVRNHIIPFGPRPVIPPPTAPWMEASI